MTRKKVEGCYPEVGKVFEMTIDGDDPAVQPMTLVKNYRMGIPGFNWRYRGKKIRGKQTRKFKLVRVGRCSWWQDIFKKIKAEGKIPEGQWFEAFKAAYPEHDGKGPIGVADPAWENAPRGLYMGWSSRYFPCVFARNEKTLTYAYTHFRASMWRWLVEVE